MNNANEKWTEFFKKHEDYNVEAYYYEGRRSFTLEELYQAFKARLKAELVADVPGVSHYGLLGERTDVE